MAQNGEALSVYEFFKRFPDEAAAIDYLESRRWSDGVICVHCEGARTSRMKDSQYHQCKDCRKKFTVRTGTIFERSHIPLDKWLYTMYAFQTARRGISSIKLAQELGITQKSAWFMLHRIREACDVDIEMLDGIVEVDETFVGGKEANKHGNKKLRAGRGSVGKQVVLGLRQRGGPVISMPITDTSAKTLEREIYKHVKADATVYTDEHAGYINLKYWYDHDSVSHGAREYVAEGGVHTNSIESVWGVLKRMFLGVYYHWAPKHTARYANECTFRLNEGNMKIAVMDRIDSLVDASRGKRLTYRALIA